MYCANKDGTKNFNGDNNNNWDFVGNPFMIIGIQADKEEPIQILSNHIQAKQKPKKIVKHHHMWKSTSSQNHQELMNEVDKYNNCHINQSVQCENMNRLKMVFMLFPEDGKECKVIQK